MKDYAAAPSGTVDRARGLRRDAADADAEKRFWRALREVFLNAKFRRQSPVGRYIVDFLSFRHKLIIEVDDGQHIPEADAPRTRFLGTQGYRVLRFWNNDVLGNTQGVMDTISRALGEKPQAGR